MRVTLPTAKHHLLVLPIAVSAAVACSEQQPRGKLEAKPAPTSAESIPDSPLSGRIQGKDFELKSARYILDSRKGYERVDVKLSAASAREPCGTLEPRDAPAVWLRRRGAEPVRPEKLRFDPGEEARWEVHYQVKGEHSWVGNGDASALLVIRKVTPDLRIHGDLSACFADGFESCVSGTFTAAYCKIRIDAPVRGTEAMERPPAGKMKWHWKKGDGGADAAAVRDGEDQGAGEKRSKASER